MKPLKLTIKNIASFTGEHAIDFSLLGNMFLICGKTGSGKTTVLDSLTLYTAAFPVRAGKTK